MALVNRWYRILETLVAQRRVGVEEMRADLNVSLSTLQKSLEQLNDLLAPDLEIKQEEGLLSIEVYDYIRLEEILAGSLRKESDFNSSSKRCSYLIKRLLQSAEPLRIDDLAEEIGVSRTTINKDLKQVKELAESFQVTISGKPNWGLEVVGTEFNLRLFYLHHVYAYFDSDTLVDETKAFLEELYETFRIPKKTQELMTKVIAITVARVKRHKPLIKPISYYSNDLLDSELMVQLIYYIEMQYQLSLSQYEQDFLSFPLNTQYVDGLDYQPRSDSNLQEIYSEMIQEVQHTLMVQVDEKKLFLELHTHLKFLLNRLIFHVQARDIFHGEIQHKYPLAFEMARVAGDYLEGRFGHPVELSELSYLALYFEMILREDTQELEVKKRKIAVVCTTGRGTANMIFRQLHRVLGRDIEITQYSEENFNPEADDDYFAIFTTIPLKLGNLQSPLIHITNLFDDQWLREEWQRVNRYHQKNLETIVLKFIRLPKAERYEDYLITMASQLQVQGLVDQAFVQRTLDREEQQSTIFGNGIGFPHTINQLDTKTVLMLGVLEEAHIEGKEPVELIFLVAIPHQVESKMEAELLELYDDIFRIANDAHLKSDLKRIQTEAEFIDLTRSKGVF